MIWLKWHEIKAKSLKGKLWYRLSDVIQWFRIEFVGLLNTLDKWAVKKYNEALEKELRNKE